MNIDFTNCPHKGKAYGGANVDKIPSEKILIINDMEWVFFILFNRGRLKKIKDSAFYNHFGSLGKKKK